MVIAVSWLLRGTYHINQSYPLVHCPEKIRTLYRPSIPSVRFSSWIAIKLTVNSDRFYDVQIMYVNCFRVSDASF